MADFEKAYARTSIFEGGYANNHSDKGGETWKGIARNMHPEWEGWHFVDQFRIKPGFPSNLKSSVDLEYLVKTFYKQSFWDIIRGDEIDFQEIADATYDDAVNTGPVSAIKKLQNSIFGLSDDQNERMFTIQGLGVKYGQVDKITLRKINLVP